MSASRFPRGLYNIMCGKCLKQGLTYRLSSVDVRYYLRPMEVFFLSKKKKKKNPRRLLASTDCHLPESTKSQNHLMPQLNPICVWNSAACSPGLRDSVLAPRQPSFWTPGELFREDSSIGHIIPFPSCFFNLSTSAEDGDFYFDL